MAERSMSLSSLALCCLGAVQPCVNENRNDTNKYPKNLPCVICIQERSGLNTVGRGGGEGGSDQRLTCSHGMPKVC